MLPASEVTIMANLDGKVGLALRHADKVVFLALLGWCSSTALGAVSTPADVARARAQGPLVEAVDAHMADTHVDAPRAPRWDVALREQLDPRAVPPARPFPAWLLERRPAFLFHKGEGPKPPEVAHAAGKVEAVAPDGRYSVRLTVARARGENVVLTQVLERRAGEGPWTRVKELGAGETEVTDVALAPRGRYTWRVVSTATLDLEVPAVEAAVRTGRMPQDLPAAVARVEGAPSAEHVTQPDVHIVPRSIELDPLHPDDATADLVIHRWNPVTAKFDARSLPRVKVGQAIGEGPHATGSTLIEVGARERPNPQFGWPQRVQWIKVRDADGSERELIDLDLPDELKRPRK